MTQANNFQFTSSVHSNTVTLLSSVMSDFSYSKHMHEEYSLGVTLKGRQDFCCRNSLHKSPAGGVLVFNPEDVHDGRSGVNQQLEYIMLYIHPSILKPLFNSISYCNHSILRIEDSLLDDPILRHNIVSMSQLIQQPGHSKIEFEAGLFQIAQSLVRHNGTVDMVSTHKRKDKLLQRAKDFIFENCVLDISIDDIAEAANISKFHFIRLFSEQFGITPHQFVLNCRINHARKSLEAGLPSSQAAAASGFADSSHLNRRFKAVFGMTPKQYQIQRFQ
ncbi:MAG: AraC family transcriptional regulator [Gammaproteobacteria bacterium]|nr:AraC family transcriptional regulator [Gammaproteobacteria bacterium]